jgi:RsbT co-antagonist protein rsbRD N-terminal domain
MTKADPKRVPDVIEEQKDELIRQWLERVNQNPELMRVSLSEAERKDHVPDLLQEALARACGHRINAQERQRAAERHGTLRYHQGYSIPMLILEAQLLQDVIVNCIRENSHNLELDNLVADTGRIADTIITELLESVRAYMSQYDWRASRRDTG